ncbi:MAG: hypothetical protein K1X28_08105 [Parachlamydiales bacterium]|nr:hypothetical protein [Parachlamydiales bacterium]
MAAYRTYPLRTTLVVAVLTTAVFMIAIIVISSGLPAYFRTEKTFKLLWQDLAIQVSENATEQTLKYFQDAPITTKVIEGLVEESQLTPDNFETIFDICYRVLKANPNFVNVFYVSKDKAFYGVLEIDNRFVGSYRKMQHTKNFRIGEGNKWVQSDETTDDYDPEKRPYWKTAMTHPEGGWTDPYIFATTKARGYTYVIGQTSPTGIIGYWGIDFQIDHLSEFIKTLKLGNQGAAWIVAQDGMIIAQTSDASLPPLGNSGFFSFGNRIYYVNPFPDQWKIPWKVVTSVHENDYIRPIRKTALYSLLYGIIPSVLFLLFSAGFFGRVSIRLKEIAWEMDELSHLTFKERPSDRILSRIREINMMNRSIIHLRAGLESFSKYIPVNLVKKLISSGQAAAAGAEKKQITVLFTDLSGFTSMAESLNANEVTDIVVEFLTAVSNEVHREKGIIDKFIGDAVMALWGTPEPMENHALAACRAALAIQKNLASNPKMKHRIGINTGMAMVGNFGSNERLDYTAIGDTVNVASRLEKLSKQLGVQILIGPDTASAVEKFMDVRPLKSVHVEGREAPLLVYELIGEKNG